MCKGCVAIWKEDQAPVTSIMSMLKKKNSNHDAGSSFPARRCSSYPVFRQTETPSSPTSSCCPSSSPNGRGVKTSTPAWWSSYIFNLVFDGFSFPLFLTVYCLCFVWLYRCTLFDVTLPPPLSFNVDEDGKPHLHLRSSWTIEAPQPTISTVSSIPPLFIFLACPLCCYHFLSVSLYLFSLSFLSLCVCVCVCVCVIWFWRGSCVLYVVCWVCFYCSALSVCCCCSWSLRFIFLLSKICLLKIIFWFTRQIIQAQQSVAVFLMYLL